LKLIKICAKLFCTRSFANLLWLFNLTSVRNLNFQIGWSRNFVALLLLLGGFVAASRAERLPIRVFTSSDGLGSSFVDFLMRDSRGFMWFATRDGLSRFDGEHFVTYQVGEGNAAPGIELIFETRGGTYWITTTGGIYRFRADVLSTAKTSETERPILNAEFIDPIRGSFFEDRRGNLYLAAGKLYRLGENAEGKVEFAEVKLNLPEGFGKPFGISEIRQASDESLWIKTTLGILRRLPDERVILFPYETDVFESTVMHLVDAEDKVWLSVGSRLYVINPAPLDALKNFGTVTVLPLRPSAIVQMSAEKVPLPAKPDEIFRYDSTGFAANHSGKFLFQTSDRVIWLGTGSELLEFDGTRFRLYTAAQGLVESRRMAEDTAGNLWIGGAKGLARLDRKGLRTFKEADGLQSSYLYTVQQGADGKIYTAQGINLFSQLENGKFRTVTLKVKPDSRVLWSSRVALRDSRGEWWVASQKGLYRFPAVANFEDLAEREPLGFYDKSSGLRGSGILQIYEDTRGDVWFSTRGSTADEEGLTRWSRETGEFYTFSDADGFPRNKAAVAFVEDKNGSLWISFYQGGLARYNNGRFVEIDLQDKVPAALISDLLIDLQGRLWLASTRAGLFRIDNLSADKPELTVFNTANGLSSNNVRTITQDFFGNIYAGTVRGVDKLSPDTGRVKHYSIADGLAGDFVVDSLCDKTGTIWFATMDGLSSLTPLPDDNRIAPQTWISSLAVNGLHQPVGVLGSAALGSIELAPTENNLQINFFGLNFNPSDNLRFQYKLEGADKDWNAPTDQRTVSYANLNPGTYRFLVRSINGDGVVGDNPAVVSFVINPPLWQRRWFIALAILTVGGLIFALDRYRVAKTKQVENALKLSRESETRFRTLAETASDAILTIDEDSRILFVNPALEKIFGYTANEMIGEKLTILMPAEFRSKHEAGLQKYLIKGKKNIPWSGVELPGKHKTGRDVPLEVSFGEFERDGKRYFTGIIRDISERKHAEEELKRAREERLKELERVRTRIATDLHDDIGASLTQIAVLTEVARSQAAVETVQTPLERIASVSNELVEAMADIVWAINPRKDNLRDLTQRMRRFAADVLSARNIKFVLHTPPAENNPQLGANIRRELFAVFKECVNNIARHSGASQVEIDFQLEPDALRLTITDNGRGFDTEQILSGDFAPDKGGNGLINLRRRAAELGGVCQIISAPDKGTTIIFQASTHPAGENNFSPTQTGGANGNGHRLN
jgi:PAS domain S-box-containing protein